MCDDGPTIRFRNMSPMRAPDERVGSR